jgi:Polyribonucleotide nucleotidyltransferase (polynucleotide phosphorylase)
VSQELTLDNILQKMEQVTVDKKDIASCYWKRWCKQSERSLKNQCAKRDVNDEGVVTVAAPDESQTSMKIINDLRDITAKAELNKIYSVMMIWSPSLGAFVNFYSKQEWPCVILQPCS